MIIDSKNTEIVLDDFKESEILGTLFVETNLLDGCVVDVRRLRIFTDGDAHHFLSG